MKSKTAMGKLSNRPASLQTKSVFSQFLIAKDFTPCNKFNSTRYGINSRNILQMDDYRAKGLTYHQVSVTTGRDLMHNLLKSCLQKCSNQFPEISSRVLKLRSAAVLLFQQIRIPTRQDSNCNQQRQQKEQLLNTN